MSHSFRRVGSVLLVAALAGCVEGGGVEDAAPATPPEVSVEAEAPGSAGVVDFIAGMETPDELPYCDVDFTPDEVRFGIVEAGATATLEVALRNDGAGPCVVRNLQLCKDTDPAWSLPGGPFPVVYIPAGAEYRFVVQFAPEEGTCHEGPEGCLEVDVGPGPDGHRTLALDCPAAPAAPVLVAPEEIDFGSARPACAMRQRELAIINITSEPVHLASVELGEGTPDSFVILASPEPGTVIPPAMEVVVTLGFLPMEAGAVEGSVFVTIAGYPERFEATLVGGGALASTVRDTFQGTGARACFPLVYLPEDANADGACSDVDDELHVFVDGAELPSTAAGEPVWAYDHGQNAVCFAAGQVPADDARIDVDYRIACLPW